MVWACDHAALTQTSHTTDQSEISIALCQPIRREYLPDQSVRYPGQSEPSLIYLKTKILLWHLRWMNVKQSILKFHKVHLLKNVIDAQNLQYWKSILWDLEKHRIIVNFTDFNIFFNSLKALIDNLD